MPPTPIGLAIRYLLLSTLPAANWSAPRPGDNGGDPRRRVGGAELTGRRRTRTMTGRDSAGGHRRTVAGAAPAPAAATGPLPAPGAARPRRRGAARRNSRSLSGPPRLAACSWGSFQGRPPGRLGLRGSRPAPGRHWRSPGARAGRGSGSPRSFHTHRRRAAGPGRSLGSLPQLARLCSLSCRNTWSFWELSWALQPYTPGGPLPPPGLCAPM